MHRQMTRSWARFVKCCRCVFQLRATNSRTRSQALKTRSKVRALFCCAARAHKCSLTQCIGVMTIAFAQSRGATFPLFGKVDVNGEHTAPLFAYLKDSVENGIFGTFVKWNFTKVFNFRQGSFCHCSILISKLLECCVCSVLGGQKRHSNQALLADHKPVGY